MLALPSKLSYLSSAWPLKSQENPQAIKEVPRWDLPTNTLSNLKERSTEISIQFKFAMALTNQALDSGHTSAQLTGSLLAYAYGGARIPKDIDIDMHGDHIESFRRYVINKVRFVAIEHDLFQIVKAKSSSGCIEFIFKHITTEYAIDPFDLACDADEVLNELVNKFSTEQEHQISLDMNPPIIFTDVKMEEQFGAHVKPAFLIASYVVRMDEEKNDREQIACLISHLRESGYSKAQIFSQVRNCINQASAKYARAINDLDEILNMTD